MSSHERLRLGKLNEIVQITLSENNVSSITIYRGLDTYSVFVVYQPRTPFYPSRDPSIRSDCE